MQQSRYVFVTLACLLQLSMLWSKTSAIGVRIEGLPYAFQDSLEWADYYYNIHRYEQAIPIYKKNLDQPKGDKTHILKRLALSEAAIENPAASVSYVNEYLQLDFEPTFLSHEGFDTIRETKEFSGIWDRIVPKINAWTLFYFFISLIGFYITAILLLNKKIDRGSRILIAFFVFIHSLFILNICLNRSNYVFQFPHTYLMSSWSAFLYGPLLYFYYKRVSLKHKFQRVDLWHLLPTLGLILFLIPDSYAMSASEKVNLLLNRLQDGINYQDTISRVAIVSLKAISLGVYAFLVHRILKRNTQQRLNSRTKQWQKNIYYIHVAYVITYTLYGISISTGNPYYILYHTPVIFMATMVVYIGYAANVQPDVFSGMYTYTNRLFPKYVKSGLTESLSLELKENLNTLFKEEKFYRRNDINLDMVAKKLNTTRHNASQIINEHFKMSFHEFVNHYRIQEAKELLQSDKKLNIIDIAYEVGYNNKVTFNKAFKKDTQLTPTQYLDQAIKKKSPKLSEIGIY